MTWLVRLLFGPTLDRFADEMVSEFERLSHCHVCGACICNQHNAFADDDFDTQRRICERCMVLVEYQSKVRRGARA